MVDTLFLKIDQEQGYVILKNAYQYLYTDIFGIVDEYNRLSGYCFWNETNSLYIMRNDNLRPPQIIRLIGEDKLRKLKDDETIFVWCIKEYTPFNKPLPLRRRVNGVRRPKPKEHNDLLKMIVRDKIMEYKVTHDDRINYRDNYNQVYSFCEEHNLTRVLLKVIRKTDFYNKDKVKSGWDF